jgi:hypothetical protein
MKRVLLIGDDDNIYLATAVRGNKPVNMGGVASANKPSDATTVAHGIERGASPADLWQPMTGMTSQALPERSTRVEYRPQM